MAVVTGPAARFVVAMLTTLLVASGTAAAATTARVSVNSGWEQGNGDSGEDPSSAHPVSSGGRYVAFVSEATDLVPGDTNDAWDVFVRDRQSGTTERVSVSSSGTQGNANSFQPALSPDGRFVAFSSSASNLVPGDSNGQGDVFLRDRESGTTIRASVGADGSQANGASLQPAISTDPTRVFVAFSSVAENLVGDDSNGRRDVFVRDLGANTTELISRATGAGAPQANGDSERPSIATPDNDPPGLETVFAVAFDSEASNLVGGDSNGTSDVFVVRREIEQVVDGVVVNTDLERASVSSAEAQGNNASIWPSISATGGHLAFQSQASNLIAADGNGAVDVFLREIGAGTTERLSVSSSEAEGNGGSFNPSIAFTSSPIPSQNTVRVAFTSGASNLVSGDDNGKQDVFVRNRTAGSTERASVAWGDGQSNDQSGLASLSPDGRYIGFRSVATNLVAGDTNAASDVFVRDRVAAPQTPDTAIDSGPPDVTGSTSATLTYSGDPTTHVDHFECSLDGAPYATCPGRSISYSALSDGPHELAVRVIDPGGGADPTPATHAWTVDTSIPEIEVSLAPVEVEIRQGRSKQVTISLERLNGSEGDVTFAADGLPPGVSASFTPNPLGGTAGTTTMRLTADSGAPPASGFSTVTVTATPAGPDAGNGPRSTTLQARVVPDCEQRVTSDYLDVRAGCIVSLGDSRYRIEGSAEVNGLELSAIPLSNSGAAPKLTIDVEERTVEGAGKHAIAAIASTPIPFHVAKIDWDLGGRRVGPRTVEDSTLSGLRRVFNGLPAERVKIALTRGGEAIVTPTLRLGFWPFNSLFGALTSTATFTASNDDGADFTGLELHADKIEGVGVRLKDVNLKWRAGGNWDGAANVALLFASPVSVDGEFSIKAGDFDFLRAKTSEINKPIGAGVYLQRLGFEASGSPPKVRGDLELTAGPVLVGQRSVSIDGSVEATFADPFVIRVDGEAKLLGRWPLAEAAVRYSSTGYFEILGKADWDLHVGYIDVGVLGWVDGLDAFSLEGSGSGCIRVKYAPDPCASVAAIVSSKAIGACVDLTLIAGGIAHYWGNGFDLFSGCDLERFRPVRRSAAAAGPDHVVRLKAGLPQAAIKVRGDGAPPAVTLRGPNGESLALSEESSIVNQPGLAGMMGADNSTYLMIRKPAAGRWTISPSESSPAVLGVEVARGLKQPRIRADVKGSGRKRTLSWRQRRVDGQRVTFVETGRDVHNVIATTSKPRGRARFRLAQGQGGRRKIVALVEQDDVPRANIQVASFRAPSTLRPAKPRRVQAKRKRSSLKLRWRAPRRGGFRHAVYIKLDDGRRVIRIVRAGRRSVKVKGVRRRVGARIKIAGLSEANGRGPAAGTRVKPARGKKGKRPPHGAP